MPAVTLISTIPSFASKEEHASAIAATPISFSDIPTLLKHKETNVLVSFEPPREGYESAVQGTLYILTSVLVFMPNSGSSGFQIEYPAITLHAVSRGESIYCQLDETYGISSGTAGADENSDAEMRELTIHPQVPNSVEAIFEALSQCASLHPDPEDDGDEGNDESFVDESAFETFNGDENEELSEVGRAALAHMEAIICDPQQLLPEGNYDTEEGLDDVEQSTKEPASTDAKDKKAMTVGGTMPMKVE